MKHLLLALSLLIPLHALGLELRVGDILLQPLKCWSCRLIEEEEETPYSHVGIVVRVVPEVVVAEALGKVRTMPFAEFRARNKVGEKLSIRRLVDENAVRYLQKNHQAFLKVYQDKFAGLDYDDDFLWDNVDQYGKERIYCSELVAKLFEIFLGVELPVKNMHFQKNRELWIRFFKGTPPDGELGNSPGDFERSDKLYEVGKI